MIDCEDHGGDRRQNDKRMRPFRRKRVEWAFDDFGGIWLGEERAALRVGSSSSDGARL
jgi:hypothetical protein